MAQQPKNHDFYSLPCRTENMHWIQLSANIITTINIVELGS